MTLYESVLSTAQVVYSTNAVSVAIARPAPWVFLSRVQGHLNVEGAKFIDAAVRDQTAAEKRYMVICHDWSTMIDYDGAARIRLIDAARVVLPYSKAIHVFVTEPKVAFGVRAAHIVLGRLTPHAETRTFAEALMTALEHPTRARS